MCASTDDGVLRWLEDVFVAEFEFKLLVLRSICGVFMVSCVSENSEELSSEVQSEVKLLEKET